MVWNTQHGSLSYVGKRAVAYTAFLRNKMKLWEIEYDKIGREILTDVNTTKIFAEQTKFRSLLK